ncbi:MAG: hypothetical protein U0Z75_01215 [Deinococcaceae bacterium]
MRERGGIDREGSGAKGDVFEGEGTVEVGFEVVNLTEGIGEGEGDVDEGRLVVVGAVFVEVFEDVTGDGFAGEMDR